MPTDLAVYILDIIGPDYHGVLHQVCRRFYVLAKDIRMSLGYTYMFKCRQKRSSGGTEVGSLKRLSLGYTYMAKHGLLEIIKWARNNGFPWNTHTCAYAANSGQLEVQWDGLRQQDHVAYNSAFSLATQTLLATKYRKTILY